MNKYIDEKVIKILKIVTNKNLMYIDDNTDLVRDFGLDSIDIVQLIAYLEEDFNIIFEDDELDIQKISAYSSLKKLIYQKVK
ncbi:hypothetical protein GLV96_06910 [Staphylococcus agnetis]|uniref:acyl carrier protein n=1 Tax=Staphylococcus agnetis TaxID=985762 RepID=UPI001431D201|nr:acyl carrier protein [Staphylococcus agnetis]NJH86283.1 hypothetical protein [Staphylococcus agnetis]NJI15971.1 hypothetical protein [Staphylococcus agnetis]